MEPRRDGKGWGRSEATMARRAALGRHRAEEGAGKCLTGSGALSEMQPSSPLQPRRDQRAIALAH